jgi:hypothetical protein
MGTLDLPQERCVNGGRRHKLRVKKFLQLYNIDTKTKKRSGCSSIIIEFAACLTLDQTKTKTEQWVTRDTTHGLTSHHIGGPECSRVQGALF